MTKERPENPEYETATVERRTSERIRVTAQATINSIESFTGLSWDVSRGGICVAITEELPVGSLVDVSFTIPKIDRDVDVIGEVRWVEALPHPSDTRSWGHGIEFVTLSDADAEFLDAFVRQEGASTDAPARVEEPSDVTTT